MKTIPEQLADAMAELSTVKASLVTVQGQVEARDLELKTLKAQLHTNEQSLIATGEREAALKTQLETANGTIAVKDADVARLTKEAKDATARATELAAKVGVPPVPGEGAPAGDKGTAQVAADPVAAVEAHYRKTLGVK